MLRDLVVIHRATRWLGVVPRVFVRDGSVIRKVILDMSYTRAEKRANEWATERQSLRLRRVSSTEAAILVSHLMATVDSDDFGPLRGVGVQYVDGVDPLTFDWTSDVLGVRRTYRIRVEGVKDV